MRKMTAEEYSQRFHELVGDEYSILDPLSYYFNRRDDPCWLIKLYKELQPAIIDTVNNN